MTKIIWDDSADMKLLYSIIATSVSKVDYAAVAKMLGDQCTINAIKHRLARIKSKMNQANGNASSPSTTPIKPKRGKPSKKRPAEDDEDQENATKKRIGGGSDC
ncbi:hypothetical protein MferCBS31731_001770 [Microsporum ferrugineum]